MSNKPKAQRCKLVIVEGIPGSGKTSTAQYISDWMENNGAIPMLYLENAHYHPVDLDNLAIFSNQQYEQFIAEYDTYHHYLTEIAEPGLNGYFLHYLSWFDLHEGDIPKELLDALMLHDAHNTLSPDRYLDFLLERWGSFSKSARDQDEITILECCLLQNPVTVFMGKHNYSLAGVRSIVYELAARVRELHPIIIQLRGNSVRDTLQRVIATRPQNWIELVIEYITQQGYGKAHQLKGLDGVITFYEMMRALEDEVITNLQWDKLVIDNSAWDWEQYHSQIEVFLEHCIA